jgi:hypothetical protein
VECYIALSPFRARLHFSSVERNRRQGGPIRYFACFVSFCLLLSSCAQAGRPATVHLEMAAGNSEHDETVYPSGDVIDVYPDRVTPHQVIARKANGGKIDAICLNTSCSNVHLQITGSKVFADGAYQLLQTDDPKLMMVRDGEGTQTLGYLATNANGAHFLTDPQAPSGGAQFFPDLQQAQAYEHKGDTARTVGKVVVGALLVTALVVLVGVAAASEAQANTVTTRCSSAGSSTTCTGY